jgi:hypothetical protein
MHEKNPSPLRRCYLTTVSILLSGLIVSLVIYLLAEDDTYNPIAEYEGSKKFAYELERIGGKSAVVANEFNNWFAGLWHGRQLAFTIAGITVLVAIVYYFIASGVSLQQQDGKKRSEDE